MTQFGNSYEIKTSLNFFKRHWKLLTIVFVVAFFLYGECPTPLQGLGMLLVFMKR